MPVVLDDTIVALATPPGTGAIAVLRISGPQAVHIISQCFLSRKGGRRALNYWKANVVRSGFISQQDEIIDEVVVACFLAPNSYTAQDIVEISCHGSLFIQQRLLQLFISLGARAADRGEFTMRAFINGKMDLSQAEAVADLVSGESELAHHFAMQQLRGSYSSVISSLRDRLVNFASLVELELDFSEEDVEFADRTSLRALVEEILSGIKTLLDGFEKGNAIRKGIPVAIVGRPNAGKSTLLNALLGDDRAIVSDIPGTTRDTVEDQTSIGGITFRFIDTAGIRQSQDVIEKIGIERTFEAVKRAYMVIYLFDAQELSREEVLADVRMLEGQGSARIIVIANKCDKGNNANELPPEFPGLSVSARLGTNLDQLRALMLDIAGVQDMSGVTALVTNARHAEALHKAKVSLDRVHEALNNGTSGELLAFEIRDAISALGDITGQVTSEDLLHNIFGKFCIGK